MRDEQVAVVLCAYSGDGTPSAALIRRIRSRSEPAIHDVGIVALVDEPWAADRAAQAGADAVLVRPVHSSRLLTVINQTAASSAHQGIAAPPSDRRAGSQRSAVSAV